MLAHICHQGASSILHQLSYLDKNHLIRLSYYTSHDALVVMDDMASVSMKMYDIRGRGTEYGIALVYESSATNV